jgi:hypothetical protein
VAIALATGACGGGSAKPLGLIGADCSVGHGAACASNNCLVLDSSTAYCTQACQAPTDCPNGFLCAPAPTGGSVCQQLGAGGVCSGDTDCPAGLKCDTGGQHCYIPVTRSACGRCTSDLQCGSGACHAESTGEQFCADHCSAAGACAAGFTCSGGLCLPASGSCRGGRALCAPCAGDIECGGPGDLCVRNLQSQETFCGTHCSADADCPKNFACVDLSGTGAGPSQCVPNSGTCAGYCDAAATDTAAVQRECGLGSTCDLTNRTCVRTTDGSLCAACATDDDCTKKDPNSRCVSNRTVGSPYLGERFCGTDCSLGGCSGAGCTKDPSKCESPQFTCAAIGQGGTWPYQCVPVRGSCVAGFGKLGDSCEKGGPDDCVSAICAQFGQEQRCSAACSADADCGDAHWRCCASSGADKYDCTHGPASGAAGICAPAGGSFGDDCSPGTPPCQDGLCLDLGTAQLCSKPCSGDGDCIAGFTCQSGTLQQADGTLGSSVKVCFPSGGGAVGSACVFGPAACQSHLCLKKDSGNVCTTKCTVTADCPDKWACAQEPMPDGTQVFVCLPPGTSP